MGYHAVLLTLTGESDVKENIASEFYQLYRQTALLALAERRLLTEDQVNLCLERLCHQLNQ